MISVFVVAVLCAGAATTAACTKTDDGAEQTDAQVDQSTTTEGSTDEGGSSEQQDEGTDTEGTADDDDVADPVQSSGELSDLELSAIEAELAAMEAELDALVFPDDDFSDIEDLLDQ